MAQLSRVHPTAEGVVPERVPRGPFIKPPAMRVVADSDGWLQRLVCGGQDCSHEVF
jgi:hypothetical protein